MEEGDNGRDASLVLTIDGIGVFGDE